MFLTCAFSFQAIFLDKCKYVSVRSFILGWANQYSTPNSILDQHTSLYKLSRSILLMFFYRGGGGALQFSIRGLQFDFFSKWNMMDERISVGSIKSTQEFPLRNFTTAKFVWCCGTIRRFHTEKVFAVEVGPFL